jgi:chorismate mutase
MANVAESSRLVDGIVRLRRVERIPGAAEDVAPVRRDLESRLGRTLSRSRAAHILGVSQTALDRWVSVGEIPVVQMPSGRREVPRQVVIELLESIEELRRAGRQGRPLAAALRERRRAAEEVAGLRSLSTRPSPPEGHRTAERRSLAYHATVADRLDEAMVEEARDRVERLAADGHLHPHYAAPWRSLLAQPIAEIAAAIVADDQVGRDLRQNTPFAGVLNEQERRRIIETVR